MALDPQPEKENSMKLKWGDVLLAIVGVALAVVIVRWGGDPDSVESACAPSACQAPPTCPYTINRSVGLWKDGFRVGKGGRR
jgi:hypothetical protein